MPYMAIIVSQAIPAEKQAEMAAILPDVTAVLKSSPGVKNVYAGAVVVENGVAASVTKLCQVIEFESPKDAETLKTGNHFDEIKARVGEFPEPESNDIYEVKEFPKPEDLKAITQITIMTILDLAKEAEAQGEMLKYMEGSSLKGFGGKSLSQKGKGVIFVGWDSKEQIKEAKNSPEAAAIKENFGKFGTETTILVTLKAAI